jgi:hypothetical protein
LGMVLGGDMSRSCHASLQLIALTLTSTSNVAYRRAPYEPP